MQSQCEILQSPVDAADSEFEPLAPMKILISMFNAAGYGGAAMVVLELAEALVARGHQVDLCAWWMANPMATHFRNAGVVRREKIHRVNPFDYDVVIFLHHSAPLHFSEIRRGDRRRTLILFFRLSHSSNMGVPSPVLEDIVADRWFVNSVEVKRRLVNDFGVPVEAIDVFHNAAPASFAKIARLEPEPLRHVIYVSNHQNQAVVGALQMLRQRVGITTTHYGTGGEIQTRITPNEIAAADVVITMAKTAQFALLARRPVYIYDYQWGGPGYLSPKNFEAAAQHNFSGSYAPQLKSSAEIAVEIASGYKAASKFACELSEETLAGMNLDRTLDYILELHASAGLNEKRIEALRAAGPLLNRERAYVEATRLFFRRERSGRPESTEQPLLSDTAIAKASWGGRQALLIGHAKDYIIRQVQKDGQFYEREMLEFIRELDLGGTYIDVGANIGNHTVFWGLFCRCARILAFEPYEISFRFLQRNLEANRLAEIVVATQMALADRSGRCDMQIISPDNLGRNRRVAGSKIPVATLDAVVGREEPVTLIKMDVEGDELAVIRGASGILARHRPALFIEAAEDEQRQQVDDALAQYGYSLRQRFNATPTYYYSVDSAQAQM